MRSATKSSSPPTAVVVTAAATTATTSSDGNTDTSMTTMMNVNNNWHQQQQVDGELKSIMPSNPGTFAANSGTNGGTSMTRMTPTTEQNIGTATKPKQRHHHGHSLKSQPASRQQLFNIDDDNNDDDNDSDKNILHHQYSSIVLSSSALAISGGSSTDNDNAYITEIARRSIARAALHLGVEGMEGIALDTLGSVLLGYLEMVRCILFYLVLKDHFFASDIPSFLSLKLKLIRVTFVTFSQIG